MIDYLIGGAAILFLALLIVGAVTKKVQLRSCCSIPDPTDELRMPSLDERHLDKHSGT